MSKAPADSVVRAITEDGAFRVIAARTTETVRGAVAAQGARGATARHFGELLTGAVLLREAMAPRLRVQAILKGAGKGSLVADSHPDGTSRGLVNVGSRVAMGAPPANPLVTMGALPPNPRGAGAPGVSLGAGALLQVMRSLPNGSLHQGVVSVPAGGGISGALMQYMQDSEQVVSTIAVAALLDDGASARRGADLRPQTSVDDGGPAPTPVDGDAVAVAGGYLVQLLPEVERGPLMVMTERLTDFKSLDEVLRERGDPDALLEALLYGMPFARLEESRLGFACHCSQLRVVASLSTLPRSDIEELVRDGEVLEIRCDYCGKEYGVPPAQLRSLLTPS